MATYASFQQVARNPSPWQAGVPTQVLLDGYTFASQAFTDLIVGGAAFFTATGEMVQQTVAGIFAGIVMRSNDIPMSYAASPFGFSNTVPATSRVQLITRGSVPVPVALANEAGSVPLIGSALYVMTATGLFQTQTVGGTAPVGGVITNFRVKRVAPGWSAGGLVEVTNTQNVGA